MDGAMSNVTGVLAGRTALVTGAGAGVGRGIALALAAAGAQVIVVVRRATTGEETAALIAHEGGRAISVQADVTQRVDLDRAIAVAVREFGGLDIVVHNASSGLSGMPAALEAISDETWDAQAAVTFDGALHCAQSALPHLKQSGRGRFVMLGSAFGMHGAAMNPVYASLKGGVRGFVKALAREWGDFGITVNAINPSAATDPSETYFAQFPQLKAEFLKNFSIKRMGTPREDIGGAVVALCSDACGYVTAQTIQVDGGLYTAT
jgi:3-oxoacyl-[acyl-carrier protein] reductase